jgi:hypothetical protein
MSVIGERNAEILGPQLKLIAQGRSRELDVLPEVGNRDRVSIKTTFETRSRPAPGRQDFQVATSQKFVSEIAFIHGVSISISHAGDTATTADASNVHIGSAQCAPRLRIGGLLE